MKYMFYEWGFLYDKELVNVWFFNLNVIDIDFDGHLCKKYHQNIYLKSNEI